MAERADPTPTNDPGTAASLRRVVRTLERIRARARLLLVAQAAGVLAASAVLGVLGLIGADFLLRLPGGVRAVLLACGIAALAYGVARLLIPALRFRPSLTQIALRVERRSAEDAGEENANQMRDLRGLLAAGVDLAEHPDDLEPTARVLRERVLRRAGERFDPRLAEGILTARRAGAAGLALAGALTLAMGLAVAAPTLAGVGLERVLAPWSDAQWPRRQVVVDVTGASVHPSDTAIALRGAVTRTNRSEGRTPVWAEFRLVTPNGATPERRVMLTSQGRRVEAGENADGELFERLVEPAALGEVRGGDGEAFLEYRLLTSDDRTPRRRIRLVEPPAVRTARAVVRLPAYAERTIGEAARGALVAGEVDLGSGTDDRAVAGPILAGSDVRLTIELNKPLPNLAEDGYAAVREAAGLPDAAVSGTDDGRAVVIEARLFEDLRLPVEFADEFGLAMRDEAVFTLDVREDAEPQAAVTAPASDESVLATAVVDLAGEGRDDLGLRRVALERRIARPVPGSESRGTVEPEEAFTTIAEEEFGSAGAPLPPEGAVRASLDLAGLGVGPGDEVWITVLAADAFELDGRTHEPVRSAARRLLVIDAATLGEQIRSELAGVRRAAQRLDEQQRDVQRAQGELAEDEATDEVAARQAGLTERLSAQLEQLRRLERRREANRLEDEGLGELLQQASELMGQAAERSRAAAQGLQPEGGERPPEERMEQAEEAQRDVRERLNQLVGLLDRGEEGWRARQALERLVEEQRRLMQQTEQAGRETVGRELGELSPQQRSELERIAQRQRDAAERTRRAIDEMQQAAEQTREQDPVLSEALRRAAQGARQAQVPQQQEQAAEQVRQNQTGQAQQQQQRAIEQLEQALEQLEEAQNNRDAALRRVLASLIESLDGLIARQREEIERLLAARADANLAGLDAPMIRLHQNTLAVADEAARAMPEVRTVAELIARAGEAQSEAIVALRAAPADDARAEDREGVALERLERARAEAERLDREAQQREQERAREELRKAYQAALEMQVAVRRETEPYAGRPRLDRRERAELRGVAQRQDDLGAELARIRGETQALAEAGVFELAHRRMEADAAAAAESMRGGSADARVVQRQARLEATLRELVEALNPRPRNQQEFDQGQQGGGSGGGQQGQQGPLIPPLAELRLLRAIQGQIAAATREASENPERSGPQEIEALAEAQRDIAAEAAELIRRMNQGPPPGAPPAQDGGDAADDPGPENAPGPETPPNPDASGAEPPTGEAPAGADAAGEETAP